MLILREWYLDLPTQVSPHITSRLFLLFFLFEILLNGLYIYNDEKQTNYQNHPCPAPEPKRDIHYCQRQKHYCFQTTNQMSAGSDMPPSLQFAAVRVFIAWTIPQSRADSHLVWALIKSALFTSSYPMVSIRICPVMTPMKRPVNQFIAAPPCRSNGTVTHF